MNFLVLYILGMLRTSTPRAQCGFLQHVVRTQSAQLELIGHDSGSSSQISRHVRLLNSSKIDCWRNNVPLKIVERIVYPLVQKDTTGMRVRSSASSHSLRYSKLLKISMRSITSTILAYPCRLFSASRLDLKRSRKFSRT